MDLRERDGRTRTGFIWLGIGVGPFEHGNETLGYIKHRKFLHH